MKVHNFFVATKETFLEIIHEGPNFHTCQDMYFNRVDLLGYTILRLKGDIHNFKLQRNHLCMV